MHIAQLRNGFDSPLTLSKALGAFSIYSFFADHRGLAFAVWGILQMPLSKWMCNAGV
jgi:hypothetical protein